MTTASTPTCPACSRTLMSRVAKHCSWCGSAILDELRFSADEIQRIEAEEAAAKRKLEALERQRVEEEKKKSLREVVVDMAVSQILKHLK